jgi:hypothetical protein
LTGKKKMPKYEVMSNTGSGWEKVAWAPIFDTEDEAWEFISADGEPDYAWDGQVDVFEIEEE